MAGDVLFVAPFLDVLGESLLLGVHPVFIESSLELSGQVLGPDGGQSSETSWGFDVTNNTADNNGRSFEDCASFDDFLLVELYMKNKVKESSFHYLSRLYRRLSRYGSYQP